MYALKILLSHVATLSRLAKHEIALLLPFAVVLAVVESAAGLAFAQTVDVGTAKRLIPQIEQLETAGHFDEAIPLAEKVLVIFEHTFGEEHPEAMDARGTLAVLYISAGAFEQGQSLLRRGFWLRKDTSQPVDVRGLVTGRALLLSSEREPPGYGLYSYLLFAQPPKDELEWKRYVKAVESYLMVLQPLEELERYKPRAQLNITLIPVNRAVELPLDLSQRDNASEAAQNILHAYDYARATILLDKLDKAGAHTGPYLISTVGTAGTSRVRLFLDISHVMPDLVWDWTQAFYWLAAQERSWSEVTLNRLALNTRNALAVAAKHLPDIATATLQWVQLFKDE